MPDFATLSGPLPAKAAAAMSEVIHAAIASGMEVDEVCCVAIAVVADYARSALSPPSKADLGAMRGALSRHDLGSAQSTQSLDAATGRSNAGGYPMSGDESRLPKWVQHELQRLRRDLADAKEQIAAVAGTTPTAIELNSIRRYDDPTRIYAPEFWSIAYSVPGGRVDVRLRDGRVHVCWNDDCGGQFSIFPRASNSIEIGWTPERGAKDVR